MRLSLHRIIYIGFCLLLGWATGPVSVGQEVDGSDEVAVPSADPDSLEISSPSTIVPEVVNAVPEQLHLGEAVFTEIHLSREGVSAVDSSGRRWWYDFSDDYFVQSHRGTSVAPGGGGVSANVEPAEIRCTTELRLSTPVMKPVYVEYTEFVEGSIIASGRVTVDGWVKGDIQSYGDLVVVTATGRVDGTVRAPEIRVHDGGRVLGETIITQRIGIPGDLIIESFSAAGIWVVFGFTLFLVLVAFLMASLGPKQLGTIDTCIREHTLKSAALGLVSVFLLPAIVVLLVLTVVGVLAVPLLLMIVLPVALVAGMMTSARVIVRPLLGRKSSGGRSSLLFESTIGVLLFMLLWTVVAVLLGSMDEVAVGFGYFFLVLAILLTTYPLLTGVGATVLTRMGFRSYEGFATRSARKDKVAPMPAPPPMPTAPGEGQIFTPTRPIPRPPRPTSPGGPSPRPPHPSDNQ